MHKTTLAAMTAVGLAAAIAIPTIAFGNARSNQGSLSFLRSANTPYVAQLSGANETPIGDTDGVGGAAVTFDIIVGTTTTAEVCWDLSYSGLTGTPTSAHIHRGAAGVNGSIVISFLPFTDLGPNSASGMATPPRFNSSAPQDRLSMYHGGSVGSM